MSNNRLRKNRKKKYAHNQIQIKDGWIVRVRKDGTIKEKFSKYIVSHKKENNLFTLKLIFLYLRLNLFFKLPVNKVIFFNLNKFASFKCLLEGRLDS